MATNEILQFCEQDLGTNLLTQSEYDADSQRKIGNQPGIARSKFVNKVLRQTSAVSAGVGEFIKNGGADCTDSQTPAVMANNLQSAVVKYGRPPIASAEGTENALYATFSVPVSLTDGEQVIVRAAMPNTAAATFAVGMDGDAKPIYKDNNQALIAGDIAGLGHWLELAYDATLGKWCLLNPKQPEHVTLQLVINTIYPVGAVYTTFDNGFDPNVTFSPTTWVRLQSGLFLQPCGANEQTGKEIMAGLPNVVGACRLSYAVGAFAWRTGGYGAQSTSNDQSAIFSLKTDDYSIYGNSDTVQPPAITVAMWKRTG